MKIYFVANIPFSGDYLMHHGIKDQKWGVRRYQNKDGSLTALGQKHRAIRELGKAVTEEDKSVNLNQNTEKQYAKPISDTEIAKMRADASRSEWKEITKEEYDQIKADKLLSTIPKTTASSQKSVDVGKAAVEKLAESKSKKTSKKSSKKSSKKTEDKTKDKVGSKGVQHRGQALATPGGSSGGDVKNRIWQIGIH